MSILMYSTKIFLSSNFALCFNISDPLSNNILDEIAYEQAKKNNTSVKEEKKKIKRGLTIGSLALFGLGGLF